MSNDRVSFWPPKMEKNRWPHIRSCSVSWGEKNQKILSNQQQPVARESVACQMDSTWHCPLKKASDLLGQLHTWSLFASGQLVRTFVGRTMNGWGQWKAEWTIFTHEANEWTGVLDINTFFFQPATFVSVKKHFYFWWKYFSPFAFRFRPNKLKSFDERCSSRFDTMDTMDGQTFSAAATADHHHKPLANICGNSRKNGGICGKFFYAPFVAFGFRRLNDRVSFWSIAKMLLINPSFINRHQKCEKKRGKRSEKQRKKKTFRYKNDSIRETHSLRGFFFTRLFWGVIHNQHAKCM